MLPRKENSTGLDAIMLEGSTAPESSSRLTAENKKEAKYDCLSAIKAERRFRYHLPNSESRSGVSSTKTVAAEITICAFKVAENLKTV